MHFIDAIYIWNASSLLNLILFVMSFIVFIVNDAFHVDLFLVSVHGVHTFHINVIAFDKGITSQTFLALLDIIVVT